MVFSDQQITESKRVRRNGSSFMIKRTAKKNPFANFCFIANRQRALRQ